MLHSYSPSHLPWAGGCLLRVFTLRYTLVFCGLGLVVSWVWLLGYLWWFRVALLLPWAGCCLLMVLALWLRFGVLLCGLGVLGLVHFSWRFRTAFTFMLCGPLAELHALFYVQAGRKRPGLLLCRVLSIIGGPKVELRQCTCAECICVANSHRVQYVLQQHGL